MPRVQHCVPCCRAQSPWLVLAASPAAPCHSPLPPATLLLPHLPGAWKIIVTKIFFKNKWGKLQKTIQKKEVTYSFKKKSFLLMSIFKSLSYLTYSWPHEANSSCEPSRRYFRHSLSPLMVMARTDTTSAQKRCKYKQQLLFRLQSSVK